MTERVGVKRPDYSGPWDFINEIESEEPQDGDTKPTRRRRKGQGKVLVFSARPDEATDTELARIHGYSKRWPNVESLGEESKQVKQKRQKKKKTT